MGHIAQRFGFSIGRGTAVLLVLALVLAGAVYWIGPLRSYPAELELLAIDGEQLAHELTVAGERDEQTGVVRFPVHLAVRNVGGQSGSPRRVTFSVPSRFRIVAPQGALPSEVSPGVPLRRYVLGVGGQPISPGEPAAQLPGLETIWIEAELPRYTCVPRDDVPEFAPAPAIDPRTLSEVRIFSSVAAREGGARNTGLLTVRVDPRYLEVQPAERPQVSTTVFEDPDAQEPELGALRYIGERQAYCGDPEQPMDLHTVTWEATGGARLYVIHVGDLPRKHLYDLNGDGSVDLETWDTNGDGRFDARREARFAVPDFLRPPPRPAHLTRGDTLPPDQAWLALFNNTDAGPFRFTREEEVAAAAVDPDAPADPELMEALGPLPPPDSAWLQRFLAADDGWLRFSDRPRAASPPVVADPGAPPPAEPAAAPCQPAFEPGLPPQPPPPPAEPEPEPEPEPPPPRPPQRRTPIGTPVPRPPPGG
jgi:hypothetical protein